MRNFNQKSAVNTYLPIDILMINIIVKVVHGKKPQRKKDRIKLMVMGSVRGFPGSFKKVFLL